jgi:hypothetical protein
LLGLENRFDTNDVYNAQGLPVKANLSIPRNPIVTNPEVPLSMDDIEYKALNSEDGTGSGWLYGGTGGGWVESPTQFDGRLTFSAGWGAPAPYVQQFVTEIVVRAVYTPDGMNDDVVYMKSFAAGSPDWLNADSQALATAKRGLDRSNSVLEAQKQAEVFSATMTSRNPVRSRPSWRVEAPVRGELFVEVYDVLGRIVYQHTSSLSGTRRVSVPSSSLSSGTYFARFTLDSQGDGSKVITKKFTVVQ